MSKEDLIPFNAMSKEQHMRMSSNGGKTVTDVQRRAAKLRELKKHIKLGRLDTDDPGWLLSRLEDPTMMSADALVFLDSVKEYMTGKGTHPMHRVAWVNAYDKVQRTLHGENQNIKVESTNLNINVNASLSDIWSKRVDSGGE